MIRHLEATWTRVPSGWAIRSTEKLISGRDVYVLRSDGSSSLVGIGPLMHRAKNGDYVYKALAKGEYFKP